MGPDPKLTSINLRVSEDNSELEMLKKRLSTINEKINLFLMRSESTLSISETLKESQMVMQKYIEIAEDKSGFLEGEVNQLLNPSTSREY